MDRVADVSGEFSEPRLLRAVADDRRHGLDSAPAQDPHRLDQVGHSLARDQSPHEHDPRTLVVARFLCSWEVIGAGRHHGDGAPTRQWLEQSGRRPAVHQVGVGREQPRGSLETEPPQRPHRGALDADALAEPVDVVDDRDRSDPGASRRPRRRGRRRVLAHHDVRPECANRRRDVSRERQASGRRPPDLDAVDGRGRCDAGPRRGEDDHAMVTQGETREHSSEPRLGAADLRGEAGGADGHGERPRVAHALRHAVTRTPRRVPTVGSGTAGAPSSPPRGGSPPRWRSPSTAAGRWPRRSS